jgi:diguanylate cyclase (GGDEF)-like protein
LLDAIVKLTSQREQETLASALVDAVDSLTDATNISIYGLGGELGHLSAKVLASSNPQEAVGSHLTPLDSRPGIRACIDGKQAVILDTDNGLQLFHPVVEQGTVVGLMTRHCTPDDDPQHELVNGLMSIYTNQQSLLNHQQRDGLTGLFNRVALQNWLSKALGNEAHGDRRTGDDNAIGCFAIFDIDYFKRINDSRGHLYGDEVLLTFADLMRESFRFNDLLFRYGGEEFVAILNDTELDTALSVLERFRSTISQHKFSQLNQVTVTIGVARIAPHLKPGALIERADKALYYGKKHGRNQVNAYEWLEQGHIVPAMDDRQHNIKLF